MLTQNLAFSIKQAQFFVRIFTVESLARFLSVRSFVGCHTTVKDCYVRSQLAMLAYRN